MENNPPSASEQRPDKLHLGWIILTTIFVPIVSAIIIVPLSTAVSSCRNSVHGDDWFLPAGCDHPTLIALWVVAGITAATILGPIVSGLLRKKYLSRDNKARIVVILIAVIFALGNKLHWW